MDWQNISDTEKKLQKRLLDVSFNKRLSHLGSCLSALPIIYKAYKNKREQDRFVLSSGHAGLALYIVLEEFYNINAEMLFDKHGVHPNRDIGNKIYCSSGSLGLGLPIAVGMALADRDRHIICLISDGECAEGSIWEALRFIKEQRIENITVLVNANGYSALAGVDLDYLELRLHAFLPTQQLIFVRTNSNFDGIPEGLESHYHIMKEEDYEKALSRFTL